MIKELKLSEFAKMPTSQRGRVLSEMAECAHAPRNGQALGIQARITAFEEQYGCKSADMREKFRRGTLMEDESIAEWLMLLDL